VTTELKPVADLLADYLACAPGGYGPGADGFTLDDVLSDYEALAARGRVPSEGELCRLHPDLASRLVAFFHLQYPTDEH
jgi:hypothetical protein